MPSRKINIRNFFSCKKDFFNALESVFLAMNSCRNCAISDKTCCINNNFEKYIKYMRSDCNCNLAISSTLIKQIYSKQLCLKKEVREAQTKLSCLKKQLNFLKIKRKK
jgi:hypothetical protein